MITWMALSSADRASPPGCFAKFLVSQRGTPRCTSNLVHFVSKSFTSTPWFAVEHMYVCIQKYIGTHTRAHMHAYSKRQITEYSDLDPSQHVSEPNAIVSPFSTAGGLALLQVVPSWWQCDDHCYRPEVKAIYFSSTFKFQLLSGENACEIFLAN